MKKTIAILFACCLLLISPNCSNTSEDEIQIQPTSENKIIVKRNTEDYNSVRNTINSIKDASETKQYIVFIPNGTYRETDIQGKKFVKIIGESRENTILICDPLGTMKNLLSPNDYYYKDQAGKKLSEIPLIQRHLFNLSSDIVVENLTISANECKYPIHLDDKRYTNASFNNCRIIENKCNRLVGIGVHDAQTIVFSNCSFESSTTGLIQEAIFLHNWNNMTQGNSVDIKNSTFINCSYLILDELGSDQQDKISLTNCTTNVEKKITLMVDMDTDKKTYYVNPVTRIKEPNPVNVPYSFSLNVTGTIISEIFSHHSGNFNPLWSSFPQRDINKFKQKVIGL